MKVYSYKTNKFISSPEKQYGESSDVLMTSAEFLSKYKVFLDDIATFKIGKKTKKLRATSYSSIGIMDKNDILQEAYLAFLHAYDIVDWPRINRAKNPEAELWSYLKKTTILNLNIAIRNQKDGIRVTQYGLHKDRGMNVNVITSLFHVLEEMWVQNEEDLGIFGYEADLIGAFMEVHMDEYLDLTREGNRDVNKNERAIMKALYGIDQPVKTYKELSDYYRISQSTIRKVKERAIKRLQSEESKQIIADFLHQYRIRTQSDTDLYRK